MQTKIRIRKTLICSILCLFSILNSKAQKFSVETNILGYACPVTFNAEMSYAPGRHWSVNAGAVYNPFKFPGKDSDGAGTKALCLKQQAYSAGVKYWPWHIYSGWWVGAKLQYQEYNFSGLFSSKSRQGDRYGGGFSFGYTYMIAPKFNITFGAGFWAGYDVYTKYSCAICGYKEKSGSSFFILPNDLTISFSFIF